MRNVTLTHLKKIGADRIFTGLAIAAMLGLSGCNSTRETFCREMPTAIGEVESFQLALAPWVPAKDAAKGPKRRIASVQAVADERAAQIESSRDAWLSWTEKALKRAQWAKDALEHEPAHRKALPLLKDASLSLVSLHGFIEQRKWKKAMAELGRVEKSLRKVEGIACASDSAPAKVAVPRK